MLDALCQNHSGFHELCLKLRHRFAELRVNIQLWGTQLNSREKENMSSSVEQITWVRSEDEILKALKQWSECPVCESDVKFIHLVDFENWGVHEKGHCPVCKLKTAERKHRLQ